MTSHSKQELILMPQLGSWVSTTFLKLTNLPCEEAGSNVKTQLGIRVKWKPTFKHQTYELITLVDAQMSNSHWHSFLKLKGKVIYIANLNHNRTLQDISLKDLEQNYSAVSCLI